MLTLDFRQDNKTLNNVLLLGAHCDDIEIGCGATLLALAESYPEAHFDWVVFSSNDVRAAETRGAFDSLLSNTANKTLTFKEFRNGFFPYIGADIKEYFETLKGLTNPDLIFTHFRKDLHQDHRVISDLTWNTFRDHMILEYEIPKYDGGLGSPNFFVQFSEAQMTKKCQVLRENYTSQSDKQWFSDSTFKGLARLRGIECNARDGYAEAFYARKVSV